MTVKSMKGEKGGMISFKLPLIKQFLISTWLFQATCTIPLIAGNGWSKSTVARIETVCARYRRKFQQNCVFIVEAFALMHVFPCWTLGPIISFTGSTLATVMQSGQANIRRVPSIFQPVTVSHSIFNWFNSSLVNRCWPRCYACTRCQLFMIWVKQCSPVTMVSEYNATSICARLETDKF